MKSHAYVLRAETPDGIYTATGDCTGTTDENHVQEVALATLAKASLESPEALNVVAFTCVETTL